MAKTLEQIEKELDEKIPGYVVSQRDGGGGRKLSYLEGHYVIDRLNKIFGPMNWHKDISDVREVKNTTSRGEFPAYLVKVRLTAVVDGVHTVKEAYGYGSDKSSQNAHELAMKEAVTDALKVAAKDLGMSLGLALYDKTQENVDDEAVRPGPESEREPVQAQTSQKDEHKKGVEANAPAPKREKVEETIRNHLRLADKQKRLTLAVFKLELQAKYNAEKLSDLKENQLQEVLKNLQDLTK